MQLVQKKLADMLVEIGLALNAVHQVTSLVDKD